MQFSTLALLSAVTVASAATIQQRALKYCGSQPYYTEKVCLQFILLCSIPY